MENYIVMLTIVKEILSSGRLFAVSVIVIAWRLPEIINAIGVVLK